ncbi:MAG: preprotein translocase subunit SecA [Xanthomonadales bacterium]|nr:preprotein translocase subunit SecA [Xanthomonadales bacterium]
MLNKIITSFIGSRNDRLLKKMRKDVAGINAFEEALQALDDAALKGKTAEFRIRLDQGESLDDMLPEAFAVVREASVRSLGLRHYDVQMIGGMVLHQGKISEMKTGEGKTLMSVLAAYLNAIPGKGVHIVTVNDYLAQRDADWMQPVFEALGLSVGVSIPGMTPAAKRVAYATDITYGTNNEFGFDYLRDNMAFNLEEKTQRGQFFAVVDEVDSILIDEARTPLIISGPADDSPHLYEQIHSLIPHLQPREEEDGPGDFSVDEKTKQVHLTEEGMAKVEELMVKQNLIQPDDSLYQAQNLSLVHHLNAGLRAEHLYSKDVDYIVSDGEVVIVDEFTGRTLSGRRWSDGLHQAIEAKEGVSIQRDNQTLASITFQNYFRLYNKLSGMTGTADTEAYEFQSIYGLEVIVTPTHREMVRKDHGDLIFLTADEKYIAIKEDIKDCVERGQPALVGTTSIETSELISKLLKKDGTKHEVLNAKQHEREAMIVENAGRPGAITIATNMAGRGTDIVLGGNLEAELRDLHETATEEQIEAVKVAWKERHEQVLESGGLHIIGTERHESRRIDNQLRGRSGRQGDAGSSRFYLSLEDNLMRIFASDRMASMMKRIGMEENEAIEHPWVSKAIENAQRKVEGHNFDMRKHLLEYDDVANDQRKVIYEQRDDFMGSSDVKDLIDDFKDKVFLDLIAQHVPPGSIDEQWSLEGLEKALDAEYGIKVPVTSWQEESELDTETIDKRVMEAVAQHFADKEESTGPEVMRNFEKALLLNILDSQWKDHLANMDYLRQGIGLRAYAQKKPTQEYKQESYEMFTIMLDTFRHEVARVLSRVQIQTEEDVEAVEESNKPPQQMEYQHANASAMEDGQRAEAAENATFIREGRKVGRNEPCPCGSGKKYKQCHGKLT